MMKANQAMTQGDLIKFGFEEIGEWQFSDRHTSVQHLLSERWEGINFVIDKGHYEIRDVVYAFLAGNEVIYVGETTRGMKSRFEGYRYGNPKETDTDNTVKKAITRKLKSGTKVSIWYCKPIATMRLPDGTFMEIPASKPFEEHLIGKYQPLENRKNLMR